LQGESAAAFQSREKHKLVAREADPLRVALVADGIGATHGVTRTLEELRELRRGSREGPRVGNPGPPRDGCEEEVSLAQDLPAYAGRCEEPATGGA
jgi:hypothetical protein